MLGSNLGHDSERRYLAIVCAFYFKLILPKSVIERIRINESVPLIQ